MAFKVVAAALAALIALPVSAQQLPGIDPMTISITPQYPRPYETVVITPQSTLISLPASTVTISVDGTVVSANGSRSATVRLGGPGSVSNVRVSVSAPDGEVYTRDLAIRPADVALVLESQSTTHSLYEGAALPAPEGRIRLVAMPDLRSSPGTRIPATSLNYTWAVGNRTLEAQSGIGRSTLTAIAPVRYRDSVITLTVATPDSSIVAQTRVTVSPTDPLVRIYRYDPLLGPWLSGALGGAITLSGSEDTFRAVPFFFGADPVLAWSVDGVERRRGADLTLRAEDGSQGSARVGITATGASATERATQALNITFGNERQGIFGF